MIMDTREKDKVYLIGSFEQAILGSKLPSYRQAFGYFLYLHKKEKITIRDASRQVIDAIAEVWERAGIPIQAKKHTVEKLEAVFTEWKGLLKHKSRTTPGHKLKEKEFVDRLDDLFDIAHKDALSVMKIKEDRDFLISQRQKGRPGCIGGIDKVETNRRQRVQARKEMETTRWKRAREKLENAVQQAVLSTDSSDSDYDTDVNERHEPPLQVHKDDTEESVPKRARINVLSPGLVSALDRTKLSSRNATYILSEMASSLGHDVSHVNINRNSIQRARTSIRASKSASVRLEFSTSVPLTVHWDGKLLEDLTNHEHVDRLPVLVSGAGVEQLLGVPKLSSGTGKEQSSAVLQCLEEWGIKNQVAALCFDTTASNTGRHAGACTLIEQGLDKDLLFLACHHHIMELIVGAAFEKSSIATSTGPEILIFKRFKEYWPFVDQEKFQMASTDPLVESMVAPQRAEILEFVKSHLEKKQPRDDYKEFLVLSMIFLGEVPARGFKFYAPGAMHRARWMSKVIYAIKIWLFRLQFRMTAAEERGIRDFATFSVIVHLRAWISAPAAAEAPLNDFRLMRQLLEYPNKAISAATSKKLSLHLWYLSEELVGLALYDSRLSPESKQLMLTAMEVEAPDQPPKRPCLKSEVFLNDLGLEQFCTSNSKRLFRILGIETLPQDQALKVVDGLAVVNDRAERGVALIQEFNKRLTKNEDQLQFLLQVVSEHRRQFPDCTKKNIGEKLLPGTSSEKS